MLIPLGWQSFGTFAVGVRSLVMTVPLLLWETPLGYDGVPGLEGRMICCSRGQGSSAKSPTWLWFLAWSCCNLNVACFAAAPVGLVWKYELVRKQKRIKRYIVWHPKLTGPTRAYLVSPLRYYRRFKILQILFYFSLTWAVFIANLKTVGQFRFWGIFFLFFTHVHSLDWLGLLIIIMLVKTEHPS